MILRVNGESAEKFLILYSQFEQGEIIEISKDKFKKFVKENRSKFYSCCVIKGEIIKDFCVSNEEFNLENLLKTT